MTSLDATSFKPGRDPDSLNIFAGPHHRVLMKSLKPVKELYLA
jgi:hypothetical protein